MQAGIAGLGMGDVGGHGTCERNKHTLWRGMALNSEEIWNSALVGSFKVRRGACLSILIFIFSSSLHVY
jgi:hypothetical protein